MRATRFLIDFILGTAGETIPRDQTKGCPRLTYYEYNDCFLWVAIQSELNVMEEKVQLRLAVANTIHNRLHC